MAKQSQDVAVITRKRGRNRKTSSSAFLPHLENVPQIISRIERREGMPPEELGNLITRELDDITVYFLSKTECQKFAGPTQDGADEESISSILDAVILKQAETLGWRLLLSIRVQWRLSEWEQHPHGPELHEHLGKALAKSSRILQGKELPPIDNPDLISTQAATTEELRVVLLRMREVFAPRHASPDDKEVLELFVTIVSDSEDHSRLKANLAQWRQFFEANPASLKLQVFGKHLSPVALFLDWLAFCKGHEVETLRKKISSLCTLMSKE